MSPRVVVIREGELRLDGDVVIDARPPYDFYDVVILEGKELRSVVAVGEARGDAVVGWGKYTGKPVAALLKGVLYLRAVPLTLYQEMGYLEREFSTREEVDIKKLVERLKKIVLEERRKYKKSSSLLALQKFVNGDAPLPSYLADVLGPIGKDVAAKVLEALYSEIY
ncbi:hypothetical protein TUZN_1959 [Thermoproteus uzoniensis 768-20]|uniref:Uncharacterized protein n=1 Tax=Thermoproteus uzoniensis (strain 768-20) TaxID=999630 RepID=F2L4R4_THEU7|nr:hypothetical protein [Thermoproteus uzoniensis]AEA13418.1 hypothetical protein TUZN_1959 [Thermoproteus uzoniensis 768-20]